MSPAFWIRRFLTVYAIGFVVLLAAGWLRGRALAPVSSHAALWAALSAAVFVGTRLYWSARGRACALCRDTPELRAGANSGIVRRD